MKIAFVIHDINRNGGQERSTLEIVDGVCRDSECHVFASSAKGLPANVKFHRVPVIFRRPLFIKDFFFRIFASLMVANQCFDLVHATGASLFKADVFTMQFIHRRWALERKRMSLAENPQRWLARLKESIQVTIDKLSEALVIHLNQNATYIAISEQVCMDLAKLYNLKKIVQIRHGVNLNEFAPAVDQSRLRSELLLPLDRKLLLFVGAFERKGLFFLLTALKNVFNIQTDWDLVVVGQGPIERAKNVCASSAIANRVHFVGSRTDVAKFYAASDLFILPSLYDPFGLVAIEALASGCPVIVSKDSGSFDLVREGENGFALRNPSDTRDLEAVLMKALSPQANLQKMKTAARQSVTNEGWGIKAAEYLAFYEKVGLTDSLNDPTKKPS